MVRDGNEIYDICKIKTERQINIKRILIMLLIILVVIGLIIIAKNSIKIIKQHKVYEQYEAQLIALKEQEEKKQIEIEREQERIRQERNPQLTQERQR